MIQDGSTPDSEREKEQEEKENPPKDRGTLSKRHSKTRSALL
jgi:hypothetical protein